MLSKRDWWVNSEVTTSPALQKTRFFNKIRQQKCPMRCTVTIRLGEFGWICKQRNISVEGNTGLPYLFHSERALVVRGLLSDADFHLGCLLQSNIMLKGNHYFSLLSAFSFPKMKLMIFSPIEVITVHIRNSFMIECLKGKS